LNLEKLKKSAPVKFTDDEITAALKAAEDAKEILVLSMQFISSLYR